MPQTHASGLINQGQGFLSSLAKSDYIITKGWERDWIDEITNTQVDKAPFACNDVVEFGLEPDVGEWNPYNDGMQMRPDQVAPPSRCMTVCRALYKAYSFNNQAIERMCGRWTAYRDMLVNSTYMSLSETWKCFIFTSMVATAFWNNKGIQAGVNCDVNLGQVDSPRVITEENVHNLFFDAQMIFLEKNRWHPGEMYVIINPRVARAVQGSDFYQNLTNYCCDGNSMLETGVIPGTLAGFRVYMTNKLPVNYSDAGVDIIFGWRQAYLFVGNIAESRTMLAERSFDTYIQMLAVYDGMAIYPDALAVAHVTVQ